MNLGTKILNIRKENKMSQEEFAEVLNVSRQTISNWENERNYPDIATIILISDKFNISLDVLLKGDAKMIATIDNQIKKSKKIKYFIIIIILLLIYTIYIICENNYNNQKITLDNPEDLYVFMHNKIDRWNFQIYGHDIHNPNIINKEYEVNGEKINVIFLTCVTTIKEAQNHDEVSWVPVIDYKNIDPNSKIKMYYTLEDFTTIKNASNEEIKDIISKSTLIFDNTPITSKLNCTLNNEAYDYDITYYNKTHQVINVIGNKTILEKLDYIGENLDYNLEIGRYGISDGKTLIEDIKNYITKNGGSCTID